MSSYTDRQADAAATLYALQWVATDLRRDFSNPAGRAALVADLDNYLRDFEIIIDIAARLQEIRDRETKVDLRELLNVAR